MGSHLILIAALCLDSVAKGFTHVGERCNSLIPICLASNSYCDKENICRCKDDYPVVVGPHLCKKRRQYNERCEYSEECRHYDQNSYCTQVPYRSICECHDDYIFSETTKFCESVIKENPKSQSLVLPTAIGLSLAFACIFCCCMVLWHICKRQNFVHLNILSRNAHSSHEENQMEGHDTFLGSGSGDEALPNYDAAVTSKSPEEECDPPPSYEEVIQSGDNTTSKV